MLGYCTVILCCIQQPLPGRLGIGDGLQGGESLQPHEVYPHTQLYRALEQYLGGNNEQCSLRVERGCGLGQVGTINVGDKVNIGSTFAEWLESFCHHIRPLDM